MLSIKALLVKKHSYVVFLHSFSMQRLCFGLILHVKHLPNRLQRYIFFWEMQIWKRVLEMFKKQGRAKNGLARPLFLVH